VELHLVGGFLGSGKTTAIISATRQLLADGNTVGVVTNDQGKYLVDTAFMRLEDLPSVEVSGGCFCCNYDDLNDHLLQLIDEVNPDVIFAESVGSCADIVATVVKPLLTIGDARLKPSSFSVFVDSRLYWHHLAGNPLPFSEDVVYIFEKQIEEAGLLVINKIDLLVAAGLAQLETLLEAQPSQVPYRFQNSLQEESLSGWLERIRQPGGYRPGSSLEIDYARYGHGEAHMAWLDETLLLRVPEGQARQVVIDFFQNLLELLRAAEVAIGHLKFILQSGAVSAKISFTAVDEPGWQAAIPPLPGGEARLLVNARVEAQAEDLRRYFQEALQLTQASYRFSYQEEAVSFFHPGQPKPTHRM
jgi:Ni2+-binding GTPase involved in maturation of urease and hydrogenase